MIEAKANLDAGSTALPIGSALIKEAEVWIGAQGDVLGSIERMMSGWIERQRQALEASSRSMRRMSDARNLFDLLLAQNEWVSDCLHWTASEIRALSADTTAVTRQAAKPIAERASSPPQPGPSGETPAGITHERAAAQ